MSPSIWTRCAANSKPRRLKLKACRVVESQYVISTRKLVDTDDEQQLLETLIDKVNSNFASRERPRLQQVFDVA